MQFSSIFGGNCQFRSGFDLFGGFWGFRIILEGPAGRAIFGPFWGHFGEEIGEEIGAKIGTEGVTFREKSLGVEARSSVVIASDADLTRGEGFCRSSEEDCFAIFVGLYLRLMVDFP